MRKKIEWVFITHVNSEVELEFYLKRFPKMTTSHSNSSNCTICPDNDDQHQMRTSYPYCQCMAECPTRYNIAKCLKNKLCVVKGINIHQPVLQLDKTDSAKQKGISQAFKEAIEDLIYRNISKPYCIYQKLILKHNFAAVPSLVQIQNYMKYIDSLKIEIPICPKLKVSVIKEAKILVEKNTIERLRIENGVSMFLCNGKHSVELDPDCVCPECTKCSCCIFLDSAVCTHLVGCCIVDSFEYPGLRTEKFISKTKSKKRKAGAWHEKD